MRKLKRLNALRMTLKDYEADSVYEMMMKRRKLKMKMLSLPVEEKEYHLKNSPCKYFLLLRDKDKESTRIISNIFRWSPIVGKCR